MWRRLKCLVGWHNWSVDPFDASWDFCLDCPKRVKVGIF